MYQISCKKELLEKFYNVLHNFWLKVFDFSRGLLTSVQHCADWIQSFDKQEPIQKCFRSLEYIFKLIIQSRLLFSRATCGQYEDSFRKDLYSVFSSLNNMLTISAPNILNSQVIVGNWRVILSGLMIAIEGNLVAFHKCCIWTTGARVAYCGSY